MLWGPATEQQDQHPELEVVKAEVSAAVSAVSVSTAEAKREKITNALSKKVFFLKQKTSLVFFPST